MGTSRALRLHIGIFGRRNTGKSSILNRLTGQEVSIVSEVAGTTTDPVEKPMELLPLGPVVFIDTAGIDDEGDLGRQRIAKTILVYERTDLALVVTNFSTWGVLEEEILESFRTREIPAIAVFNKTDVYKADPKTIARLENLSVPYVLVSATEGTGIPELRRLLLEMAPAGFIDASSILADLVGPDEAAILVVPIDKEAPKGRLILPQVQCIRDLLDHNSFCMVVRENQLSTALSRLTVPPRLVVTDSQAFTKVAADTPPGILLTSFSILFARFKGDLNELVKGAVTIGTLVPGDKILIAETCTHHPIEDDIGTVKIPAWLEAHAGGKLQIDNVRGRDFPADLKKYKLIIHCGACMWNRRSMLSRILTARQAGVPITNYGLTIAWLSGIFERALQPFPAAMEVYRAHLHSN